MRLGVLGSVVLVVLAAASAADASSCTHAAVAPCATFVGDSVSASISYVPTAKARLERGMHVRLDLQVCRRLVEPSCSYGGSAPSTALQAVESYGHALGKVLIVKVGYNESSAGYARGIDRVMRAALADGASGVVWVTLREQGGYSGLYHATNAVIRQATHGAGRSSSSPTGTRTAPGSRGSAPTAST